MRPLNNTLRQQLFTTSAILCLLAMVSGTFSFAQEKTPAPKVTYDEHVQPIFRAKCFACHNPDKKQGGLDLTSYTSMMLGGSSGEVVEPGDSDLSYLYMLVTHESEPFMPPKSEKLPATELATIKNWIDGGLLENAGSKALVKKQANNLSLAGASNTRPEGPPPMPNRLPLEPVVHTPRTTAVTALATSPWAKLLAVAGQKQVLLYNSETMELLGLLPFPEGIPRVIKFSRNGSLLLVGGGVGGSSGKVALFNVKTGERVLTVGDELDEILAADISSDQSLIALGGPLKMIRIYSTATGNMLYKMKKHTDWVTAIEFSPDSVLLATGDRNGGLFVWEAHTGREYLALNGHKGMISEVSWRSDSNILASGSEDASIKLWEMENGRQVKSWTAHGGGTSSIEFARDGHLVSCGRDKVTKLWDQNGAQKRAFEAFGDLALKVTYCDETKRVVAGDWTGLIRVWNSADGKRLAELHANPPHLKDRLAQAQAAVTAIQTKVTQQQNVEKTMKAAYAKLETDMKTMQTQLATSQQQITTSTTTMKTAQTQIATLTKEMQTESAKLKMYDSAIPPLTEATAKIDAVQKLNPTDAETKTLLTQMQTLLNKKKQEQTALQTVIKQKQELITRANATVTTSQTQIKTATATMQAAQKSNCRSDSETGSREEAGRRCIESSFCFRCRVEVCSATGDEVAG